MSRNVSPPTTPPAIAPARDLLRDVTAVAGVELLPGVTVGPGSVSGPVTLGDI